MTPTFVSLATKGKLYNRLLPDISTYTSQLHLKHNTLERKLLISHIASIPPKTQPHAFARPPVSVLKALSSTSKLLPNSPCPLATTLIPGHPHSCQESITICSLSFHSGPP